MTVGTFLPTFSSFWLDAGQFGQQCNSNLVVGRNRGRLSSALFVDQEAKSARQTVVIPPSIEISAALSPKLTTGMYPV